MSDTERDLTEEIAEEVEEDAAEDAVEESVKENDQEDQKEEAGSGETQAGTDAGGSGKKDGPKEEPEKKSFFKKKDKKDKKDCQIEELTDKLKRSMAEFENFRKRTEKEKAAMFEVGAKSVIEKILPIVDNFERGMATLSEEEEWIKYINSFLPPSTPWKSNPLKPWERNSTRISTTR